MSGRPRQAEETTWIEIVAQPVQFSIVRSLAELGEATVRELSEHAHTSLPTVRQHLQALADRGLVREEAGDNRTLQPGRPAARYSLHSDVGEATRALLEALEEPILSWPPRTPGRGRDRGRARG